MSDTLLSREKYFFLVNFRKSARSLNHRACLHYAMTSGHKKPLSEALSSRSKMSARQPQFTVDFNYIIK